MSVRYESVFAQATFQHDGHMADYLIARTDDLMLLYLQTRFGTGRHSLRHYQKGQLVEERSFASPHGILCYYLQLLWVWTRELRRFCRGRRQVLAIFSHPLLAVGCRVRRNVRTLFWQWDYFPDGVLVSRLFNAVARHFAKRVDDYRPLTRAIGAVMGRTDAPVMRLGMTVPNRFGDPRSLRLLMVGQLRPGQGVEAVLDFLAAHCEYSLCMFGRAVPGYAEVIRRQLKDLRLDRRVEFPDQVVSEEDLRTAAAGCFAALALYDTGKDNLTNYADPGKVKSAIEMGLPIVMTRISEVVEFVERFHAGEVIDSPDELPAAILRIRSDPQAYFEGCRRFAECFVAEKVYSGLDQL